MPAPDKFLSIMKLLKDITLDIILKPHHTDIQQDKNGDVMVKYYNLNLCPSKISCLHIFNAGIVEKIANSDEKYHF